ncbi:Similar to Transposon TX1 uncharacterized 82 kDa protein (Xenopus laevis) [Cotesia congregata]|uniref:Similar to Transposon TX1 uncharacterized 82 kDa protein (Xenopus laevis) n=1 Tax=Cotesia congregata TaxID=51543 RepID=A0A8J2HIE7_COTCN|nr:Similar to Transposon TX1 uncharacterized 82 kDa protein (Xenopus laevis) [Cotesia congregata]
MALEDLKAIEIDVQPTAWIDEEYDEETLDREIWFEILVPTKGTRLGNFLTTERKPTSNMTTPSVAGGYASAARNEVFPTKECAIIIEALDGATIKDYINAIGKRTPVSNIRFISKISNGRICAYLVSQEKAEELITIHKTIQVNSTVLTVRPLINKNKRIILSNVPPIIPHDYIVQTLDHLNIKVTSTITFLLAASNEPGHSHIMSFRRQVYVDPDDVSKLPEVIQIPFDDTLYNIYTSLDSIACFICLGEGHLAKNCPKNQSTHPQEQQQDNSIETNLIPTKITPAVQKKTNTDNNDNSSLTEMLIDISYPETNSNNKRPHSTSDGSISSTNLSLPPSTSFKKPNELKKNKIKKIENNENQTPLTQHPSILTLPLEILKEIEANPTKYSCSFSQLQNLIDKTSGRIVIKPIIEEFEIRPIDLVEQLTVLYPHLNSRGWKSRFTKLRNKIKFEFGITTQDNLTPTQSEDDSELDSGSESCIDLSLATPQLAHNLTWYADEDLYDSDHYPIHLIYDDGLTSYPTNKLQRWIMTKADWPQYSKISEQKLALIEIDNPRPVDELITDLNQAIREAADLCIPKSRTTSLRTFEWCSGH